MQVDKPRDAEGVWKDLKECILSEAISVCGETKGISRHKETWWWNDEVAALVQEKKRLFRLWKGSCKCKCQERCRCRKRCRCESCRCGGGASVLGHPRGVNADLESMEGSCGGARRAAGLAVFDAGHAEGLRFCEGLRDEDQGGCVRGGGAAGGGVGMWWVAGCVGDSFGGVVVEGGGLLEVWRGHCGGISGGGFGWGREVLADVGPVCGPGGRVSGEEVGVAVGGMGLGRAAGPSGVVADVLRAAGEDGTRWMTELCNAVVRDGKIPEDWSRSWLVNVYKGKGDALECGSYRGIKLVEHAMKILERVIERRVRNVVEIDSMQFGFMAGKSTTDAIFIVRQLQEKYLARNKELWMAFVDLEKAFDRVPREVVWWALRCLSVDEWIVSVIGAMCGGAAPTVGVGGGEGGAFGVGVGVRRGSVLGPLLFVIVLEALSGEFGEGLPVELLCAGDLVLVAETEELLMEGLREWGRGVGLRGLGVGVGGTGVVRCRVGVGQAGDSGECPCGVCKQGVGDNSIKCVACLRWVHKRCSGISGRLGYVADFRCRRCLDGDSAQVVLSSEVELEPGVKVECVSKFCYLGDPLGSGGGVVEVARARVRCAWAKFKELSLILTVRGASYRIKGRIYSACVQSVLIYGTETWAMKADDLRSLERTERMMVRWMCGVSLKDRKHSEDLCNLLGINCVADVVRRGRLRWFGHLECKSVDDWVSACRGLVVEGTRGRGRSRKTWGTVC